MESNPNPKFSPRAKSACREPDRKEEGFFVTCWGRLKLMKLIRCWNKRRQPPTPTPTPRAMAPQLRGSVAPAVHHQHHHTSSLDCKSLAASLSVVQPKPVAAGGFKYDPLSYSQNFDEGTWHEHDIEAFQRGFSSRYAAPTLTPMAPRLPPPPPPMRLLIDE